MFVVLLFFGDWKLFGAFVWLIICSPALLIVDWAFFVENWVMSPKD
jgi:hypothetical protein